MSKPFGLSERAYVRVGHSANFRHITEGTETEKYMNNTLYEEIFKENAPTIADLKLFGDMGATQERILASCFKSIADNENNPLNILAIAKWLITMTANPDILSRDDYYKIMDILNDSAYKLNGYVD